MYTWHNTAVVSLGAHGCSTITPISSLPGCLPSLTTTTCKISGWNQCTIVIVTAIQWKASSSD